MNARTMLDELVDAAAQIESAATSWPWTVFSLRCRRGQMKAIAAWVAELERERDEAWAALKAERNAIIEAGYNQWAPLQVANEKLTAALREIAGPRDTGMGVHRPCCLRAQVARAALAALDAPEKP